MEFDIKGLEWKPILSRNMKLFDRVGQPFEAHPIVIFEYENKIYFLKSQSAKYKLNEEDKIILDKEQQKAIDRKESYLVKPYNDQLKNDEYKTFFRQDSLVDTTQIFVMNKEEFIEYFKFDNILEKADFYTRSLLYKDRIEILTQLKNNLAEENVSITSISKKDNVWYEPKLIYSAQKFIDRDDKKALKECNEGKYIQLYKIEEYKHAYDEYLRVNNSTQKQYIRSLEEFVDYKLDETLEYFSYIQRDIGDPQLLDTLNDEVKKYSEDEIKRRWSGDIDLIDEKHNLSKYEHQYYDEHKEEYNEKFKTLFEELEEDINLKEQQETKKKDKDQEMSL